MTRRTPLYDRHAEAGAKFVEFAGFEMPVWYTGLVDEHLCVRSAVGLFDVSHMGEVRVRGPGAQAALDWLVSNTVTDLAIGQARYTLMCNEQGGVVDDLVIYKLADDDFLVVVNASNRDKDFAWMLAHNPRQDATFTDEGDDWVQIAVQGPKAVATLAPLTDVDLDAIATYHHAMGAVAGVAGCLVARTGYTGEDGFEVYAPAAHGAAVWDALLASGAPHGVQPIGLGARDTLRLEVRYPLYGHELNDELSPSQARLMWVTKLDKPGGFLGADAIRHRRDADLDTHFLAGAVIDDKRIPRDGMDVLVDGEKIGWVSSGTRSPSLEQPICLFYAKKGFGKPGQRVTFDVRGKLATGTVVKGAFVERPS